MSPQQQHNQPHQSSHDEGGQRAQCPLITYLPMPMRKGREGTASHHIQRLKPLRLRDWMQGNSVFALFDDRKKTPYSIPRPQWHSTVHTVPSMNVCSDTLDWVIHIVAMREQSCVTGLGMTGPIHGSHSCHLGIFILTDFIRLTTWMMLCCYSSFLVSFT